eukprot:tig00000204_g17736.t1
MADAPAAPAAPSPATESAATQGAPAGPAQPAVSREQALAEMTRSMFENVTQYVEAELTAGNEDYRLLARMNETAGAKYTEMAEYASKLMAFHESLVKKEEEFKPYLAQIDEIDRNVGELEVVVARLDEYTRRLENKLRRLS